MIEKLTHITSQYHKFNDNQVLTKDQLNEFLEYFEDQDHLSRIGLSGVGIVCGFDVSLNNNSITITQGYGVTTDGDLLTLQDRVSLLGGSISPVLRSIDLDSKTYTKYRTFLNDDAPYNPFFFQGGSQIQLFELISDDDIPSNGNINELDTFSDLSEMVVVLFLENYSKEPEDCTAIDCDNQGLEQVERLRVLMVSQSDAQYITSLDGIYTKHNWYETYIGLPEVSAKRLILDTNKTEEYAVLKAGYHHVIKNNGLVSTLGIGINTLYAKFNLPALSGPIDNLFSFSSSNVPSDFQYRYDVLLDLVDTYNEIKDLLLHINVECTPDIHSFPKHLMLGKVVESEEYAMYRHRFYKSPIIGHEDYNYKKVVHLLGRISLITTNYKNNNKGTDIRITPSLTHSELGKKAVPFYLDVNDSLLHSWNFDKTRNLKHKFNLSYHKEGLSTKPQIQEPLKYNMRSTDFYRIEGHQGKHYRDALEKVLELKKNNGLNFDVKLVSINTSKETIKVDDYRCFFDDLNVLLVAWKKEQDCTLAASANYISGFNLGDPGSNYSGDLYSDTIKVKDTTPEAVLKSSRSVGAIEETPPESSAKTPQSDSSGNSQRNKNNDDSIDHKVNHVLYPDEIVRPLTIEEIYYPETNIIQDSMVDEDNALGVYMLQGIEAYQGNSVLDLINAVSTLVSANISPEDDWTNFLELRTFILDEAIQLLSYSYQLSLVSPKTLVDVNSYVIEEYNKALNDLCQLVRATKVAWSSLSFTDSAKDIIDTVLAQLTSVCCSGEKLKTLLTEVEVRKQNILDQLKFSFYAKKNPGLEHLAGVQEGGTFVMVYLGENSQGDPSYDDVTLDLTFATNPTAGSSGIVQFEDFSTNFTFVNNEAVASEQSVPPYQRVVRGETREQTQQNFSVFLSTLWFGQGDAYQSSRVGNVTRLKIANRPVAALSNFIQMEDSAVLQTTDPLYFGGNSEKPANIDFKDTVIADFALPYLCCSDCTPINFILADKPRYVRLDVDVICFDQNTPTYDFTISPNDSVVTAAGDNSTDPMVTKVGTKYVFDPSKVDPSLYGQEIKFLLDGEETNSKVIVYKKIVATIIGVPEIIPGDGINSFTVKITFDTSNIDFTVIDFNWLNDGKFISDQRPTNGIVEIEIPLLRPVVLNLSLSLSYNGDCPVNIDIPDFEYELPEECILSLPEETLCYDQNTAPLPFTVQPEDSIVEYNGDLNVIDVGLIEEGGQYFFDPNKLAIAELLGQPIVFIIKGKDVTCQIIVNKKYPAPKVTLVGPNFDRQNVTLQYYFDPKSFIDSYKFNWNFGGITRTDKPNSDGVVIFTFPLNSFSELAFRPTLVMTHGVCTDDIALSELDLRPKEGDDDGKPDTNDIITRDRTDLNNVNIIGSDNAPRVTLSSTIALFDEVLGNYDNLKNGDNLESIISNSRELITSIGSALIKNTVARNKGPFAKILIRLIRVSYLVISIQDPVTQKLNSKLINSLQRTIKTVLGKLQNDKIKFDNVQNGNLQGFLVELIGKDSTISYSIKKYIDKNLIPLLTKKTN